MRSPPPAPSPARARSGTLPPAVARPLLLAFTAATLDALLNAHLYLRPSPLGGDFALRPGPYLLRAIYYGVWGHALVAAPFVGLGLWRARAHQEAQRWLGALQIGITAALLCAGGLDREFQRFLGSHISAAWLTTYGAVEHTPGVIWRALAEDRGGSWSAGVGLLAACAYVPLAACVSRWSLPARWLATRARVASLLFAVLLWPTLLWNVIPGGIQRQNKVRPVLLTLLSELRRAPLHTPPAEELEEAVALYRRHWLTEDASQAWSFDDELFPMRKHFVGPEPEGTLQPNIILLSLETFRAKNMPSFHPATANLPSPTPFLDQLAASPDSAFYPRYYSSGVPTVYAFMSIHTGLLMHPTRNVVAEATTQTLEGFPEVLRRHGYYNVHFTGSDPDWDSQRVWLRRWYDEIDYRPGDAERDRYTFRRAAARLRELGGQRAPFFASLSSISNHTPFHSPEPALDVPSPGASGAEARLRNTMHYTDDVVRELYESLRGEPWFERTIWIITGDHAFDLGERGEVLGHDNLRHETTWVPLILHGRDARLPRGEQARIASHIDLAPTLTELAGVYDDNGYMGHSLLGPQSAAASALILRGWNYAYETASLSLYRPANGPPLAYAPDDLAQERAPVALSALDLAHAERLANATRTVLSYVVDFDRQMPRVDPDWVSRQ